MQVNPAVNPGLCPLCGQVNQCAMEVERATGVKQPPCWCTEASFDAVLLSSLPAQARDIACICAACAQAAGASKAA